MSSIYQGVFAPLSIEVKSGVSFIFDYTDANFEVEKSFIGNYFALKFLIASIKYQNFSDTTMTHGLVREIG